MVTTRPRDSSWNLTVSPRPVLVEAALDLLLRALEDGALLAGAGGAGLGVGQRRLGGLGRGRRRVGAVEAGVEDPAAALERARPAGEGAGGGRAAEPAGDAFLQPAELGQVDLGDRVENDEEHHEQGDHVGVGDQPALVVDVLLVLLVELGAALALGRWRWPWLRPPSRCSRGRSAAGRNDSSFCSMTRGLAPAWTARTPSITSCMWWASISATRLSLLPIGQPHDVGREDAPEGGDEGAGDEVAELLRLGQVLEHVDQAEDGTDDAEGRGEAAHVGEELRRRLVGVLLGADLGLHDVAQLVGVGAVDGQLDALLHERVVDRLGHLLQGQQAFPAGPLGEGDERGRLSRRRSASCPSAPS